MRADPNLTGRLQICFKLSCLLHCSKNSSEQKSSFANMHVFILLKTIRRCLLTVIIYHGFEHVKDLYRLSGESLIYK